jgi:hypothetical protein
MNSPRVCARSCSHACRVQVGHRTEPPRRFGPDVSPRESALGWLLLVAATISLPRGIGLQPYGLPLTFDPAPQLVWKSCALPSNTDHTSFACHAKAVRVRAPLTEEFASSDRYGYVMGRALTL